MLCHSQLTQYKTAFSLLMSKFVFVTYMLGTVLWIKIKLKSRVMGADNQHPVRPSPHVLSLQIVSSHCMRHHFSTVDSRDPIDAPINLSPLPASLIHIKNPFKSDFTDHILSIVNCSLKVSFPTA